MVKATLTSKGQITIPKIVRLALKLHTGDRVEFVVRGDEEATLKPAAKSVDDVFGCLHKPGRKTVSVEEMNAAVSRRMRRGGR
jgi:antitoxin PrlF